MERAASRPPPGGGANWAVFFAPLAVTGVVILGALIFVWVSDPEPADRPEVETVDLRELEPVPESARLSAVPTTRQFESGLDEDSARPRRTPDMRRKSANSGSEEALVAEEDEYEEPDDDDDEYEEDDLDAPKGPDLRTPEEIAAAKARVRDIYVNGDGLLSKMFHMSLPATQTDAVDQIEKTAEAVGAETAVKDEGEPAVPAENPMALGGASGRN